MNKANWIPISSKYPGNHGIQDTTAHRSWTRSRHRRQKAPQMDVINSLDMGIPITLMAEAVYAAAFPLKDERVKAARKLKGPRPALTSIAGNAEKKKVFINDIMSALYASKIVSYAQVHAHARRRQGIRLEPEHGASPSCGAAAASSAPAPRKIKKLR